MPLVGFCFRIILHISDTDFLNAFRFVKLEMSMEMIRPPCSSRVYSMDISLLSRLFSQGNQFPLELLSVP